MSLLHLLIPTARKRLACQIPNLSMLRHFLRFPPAGNTSLVFTPHSSSKLRRGGCKRLVNGELGRDVRRSPLRSRRYVLSWRRQQKFPWPRKFLHLSRTEVDKPALVDVRSSSRPVQILFLSGLKRWRGRNDEKDVKFGRILPKIVN